MKRNDNKAVGDMRFACLATSNNVGRSENAVNLSASSAPSQENGFARRLETARFRSHICRKRLTSGSIFCKGYHHLLRVGVVIHMKQIDRAKMKFLHMNQLRDVREMRRFVAVGQTVAT
jgi:hypothetical protein